MKHYRNLLIVVLYIIPLSGAGTDLYSPSLPALVIDLSTTVALIKFTLAIYLFGFSVGQPSFGSLSDIFGRKSMLIVSLSIFCLTSFIATQIHNIYLLLAVRALQGFSAAGPSVIGKAILTDTLEGAELKKASIYIVTAWGLSPIIAPAIGGYLQHYYGWVANFYFFTLYSFSMLIVVLSLLKETNTNRHEGKWKIIINNYATLLKNRTFMSNVICLALAFSIVMIFNIFTPFLVQTVLGYTAITYGHLAMLVGAGFLAGSLSNRWLMTRVNTKYLNRTSVVILAFSALLSLFSAYFMKMSLLTIGAPVFLMVFIAGLLQTNFMTHALSLFPKMGGAASAGIGGFICLISGIISTICSWINHTSTQATVSWVYFIVIAIYSINYWFILDKESQN